MKNFSGGQNVYHLGTSCKKELKLFNRVDIFIQNLLSRGRGTIMTIITHILLYHCNVISILFALWTKSSTEIVPILGNYELFLL